MGTDFTARLANLRTKQEAAVYAQAQAQARLEAAEQARGDILAKLKTAGFETEAAARDWVAQTEAEIAGDLKQIEETLA